MAMNEQLLNFFVVHCCHAFCLSAILRCRFGSLRMIALWAAYVAVGMASSTALLLLAPAPLAKWGTLVLTVLLLFCVCRICAEGSLFRTVFCLSSYLNLFFYVVPLCAYLSLPFGRYQNLAAILLKLLLLAAFALVWSKRIRLLFEQLTEDFCEEWKGLSLFATVLLAGATVITLVTFPPDALAEDSPLPLAGTLCFLLIMLVSYAVLVEVVVLVGRLCKAGRDSVVEKYLSSQLSAWQHYVFQARLFRHDMRHHSQYLLALAEKGDLEAIRSYLSGFEEEFDRSRLESFSRNAVANAMLANYAHQFRAAGISYDVRGCIPETLPLTQLETCALFGNILENALGACAKVEGGRFRLEAVVQDGALYMRVCNSVAGAVSFKGGFPVSTKAGGGTGTRSIADILARYGGMVEFCQDGGEFSVQIILPLAS